MSNLEGRRPVLDVLDDLEHTGIAFSEADRGLLNRLRHKDYASHINSVLQQTGKYRDRNDIDYDRLLIVLTLDVWRWALEAPKRVSDFVAHAAKASEDFERVRRSAEEIRVFLLTRASLPLGRGFRAPFGGMAPESPEVGELLRLLSWLQKKLDHIENEMSTLPKRMGVTRQRNVEKKAQQVTFMACMVEVMRKVFGVPLYESVCDLTEVAFETTTTVNAVRHAFRSHDPAPLAPFHNFSLAHSPLK